MKTLLAVIGIIVVILVIVVATQKLSPGKNNSGSQGALPTTTMSIGANKYTLEVAKTDDAKKTGLSDRDSLASDHGMAFTFSKPDFYSFWMRKMQFPLDIIYLQGKRVVTIFQNVKNPTFPTDNPPIYKPEVPADTVVELPAGTTQKINLKSGDTVNLSL